MRKKVGDVLINLGITPEVKGFNYIIDMAEMVSKCENQKMMNIYEMVAEKNNTTASRTERAIRHCISNVDRNCEESTELFGEIKKISNSKFVHILVYRLKEDA